MPFVCEQAVGHIQRFAATTMKIAKSAQKDIDRGNDRRLPCLIGTTLLQASRRADVRAVTSAMADALASRSCLPGPAVTRDMRQEGGEGECRDRRSFWQLLQEYSLIVSLPIGKLPSVNSLMVPAHVVIDTA